MPQQVADAIRQLRRAAGMRCLYPAGHPLHASALDTADEALRLLLGSENEIALVFTPEEVFHKGQAVADESPAVREFAAQWWEHGIGEMSIQRGVTDEEIELLLGLLAPSSDQNGDEPVPEQLAKIGATHLTLAEVDYSRLLPHADAGEAAVGVDLSAALRDLAAGPNDQPQLVDEEQRRSLVSLIAKPGELAEALRTGLMLGGGGGSGAGGAGALSLAIAGHVVDQYDAAGVRLAMAVQRLAEIGRQDHPEESAGVLAALAEALRGLGHGVVGAAYRAVVEVPTGLDALTEVAKRFSIQELVELVRAAPVPVSDEPSVVHERMLRRLAPDAPRRHALAPALKQGLLDQGMSDDVFSSTIGMVLESLGEEDEAGPSIPVGLRRADETDRARRRQEILARIESAFSGEAWLQRAMVSVELLRVAQTEEAKQRALDDIRAALRCTPSSLRENAWRQVAMVVAELATQGTEADEGRREAARSFLADAEGTELVVYLMDALPHAGRDERRRLIQALALAGAEGRRALANLLLSGGPTGLDEESVTLVTAALVRAPGAAVEPGALSNVLLDPDCRIGPKLVECLVALHDPQATVQLVHAMRNGPYGLRLAIMNAVAAARNGHRQVLEVALDDADPDICCAAAAHLGTLGDLAGASALIPHVDASRRREGRADLRLAAIRALGELKAERAIEPLASVVARRPLLGRRANDRLRAAAADALLEIGTPQALAALTVSVPNERNAQLRAAAERAAELLDLQLTEGRSPNALCDA